MQFIVATHSPFIAQVADVEQSGLLPEDDYPEESGNVVLEQNVAGTARKRGIEPVGDYRVDQILTTPLFDLDTLYSPPTVDKFEQHQKLLQKKASGRKLTSSEEQQYEQLTLWRKSLPLSIMPEDRVQEQKLTEVINQYNEQLAEIE